MSKPKTRRQKLIALLKEEKAKTELLVKSLGKSSENDELEWITSSQGSRIHAQALGAINQHEEFIRQYYKVVEEESLS